MWNANCFQVVWFVTNVDSVDASIVYGALTDQEPDNVIKNKLLNQKSQFLSSAIGVSCDQKNSVEVKPGRVDWFIEPQLEENDPPYSKSLKVHSCLEGIRKKILELDDVIIGEATRLAIVTVLISPMRSIDEATNALVKMCKIPFSSGNLMDLSLQFNRIKQVDNEVVINRLTQFSVETSVLSQVMMNMQSGQTNSIRMDERFAIRAQLDINTMPTGQIFSFERQQLLFQALLDETVLLANEPTRLF